MSQSKITSSSFLYKVLYFFPLQLLLVHLKKNQQLLLFWLLLFLLIFKQIGIKYGVPYLFLAPEYLGKLSFSSYFIVGFSLGGFVIAFNISSYIMNGFRFPFLATLSKPFLKYSINNATIPLGFILCYMIMTYHFLIDNENFSSGEAWFRLLGFLGGYLFFILLAMSYFLATNKSFEKLFGKELTRVLKAGNSESEPAKILLSKKEKSWYERVSFEKFWRVESYFNGKFQLKVTRPFHHYDRNMLAQVFRQNHINASVFQVVLLISIILLGVFRENEMFIIPACATILLIFTILLMITSAIRSWIRGWTVMVIIGLLILINQMSRINNIYYDNRAYGLSYDFKADYSKDDSYTASLKQKDFEKTLKTLDNWKKKQNNDKPKAVFIAASGGGARAAFWSFLALQHLDSISNGKLTQAAVLGTGSSGGMIGTAYFRELKLRQYRQELNPYERKYALDMAKDILNPVVFTLAVNDALIRTQKFTLGKEEYWKDRGYTFEQILHKNTRGFLDKKLGDYAEAEQEALLPQLIFTPSIVNDGRRLFVSTLPLSFICDSDHESYAENVDYQCLFSKNDPMNLQFSTLLRMNSSFPYIMPTVSMPTDPKIDVFDSGLRDNYGIKTTLRYIYRIRHWLEENTSGIVILQIRDGLKLRNQNITKQKEGIFNDLLSPFGSLYGNWFEVQDFNNDELLEYTKGWYKGEVDLINYQLNKSADNYISLSWHLTTKEKEQILNSLELKNNKKAEKRLLHLIK